MSAGFVETLEGRRLLANSGSIVIVEFPPQPPPVIIEPPREPLPAEVGPVKPIEPIAPPQMPRPRDRFFGEIYPHTVPGGAGQEYVAAAPMLTFEKLPFDLAI